ncbi:MFS transporter [Microbacterium gilvum]|uniref:MFS transporter n=2 Tax=Microbacterium gilvum TaxID=1336204 RepID=A0ABP9A1M4_9MICO
MVRTSRRKERAAGALTSVMTDTLSLTAPAPARPRFRSAALVVMMLTSFLLVTAEFLPNGVLTEFARDLGVTPGQAGQAVTVTALVGFLVAPTIGLLVPRLDRRTLLVWLAFAAAASNLLVAIAPSLAIVLASRVLLGAALSGFWAMSLTVSARIAGPERLGRAVMFTTAGTSLATVLGVPLGVLLSTIADWRAVFAGAAVVTAAVGVAVRLLLPRVPSESAASLGILASTLRRPGIGLGLSGHVLTVFGHFTAYTYIRLALERIQQDGEPLAEGSIVVLLALFGVGGLVGNIVTGAIVDRHLALLSAVVPVLVGLPIVAVVVWPTSLGVVGAAVVVWGAAFAAWLIVLNAWIGRRLPDRLEAGGGLVVAGFQLAIMLAAAVGGLLVDAAGVQAAYLTGIAAVAVGATLFGIAGRR